MRNMVLIAAALAAAAGVASADWVSGLIRPGAFDLVADPVTNRLYVVDYNGRLDVFDCATGLQLNSISFPADTHETSITVNPVTNKIYLTYEKPGTLIEVDGATYAVTRVPLSRSFTHSTVVNPLTNKIYVTCFDSSLCYVVDAQTYNTTRIACDTWPNSVAVNPTTNRVYVGNWTGKSMTVIDGATNETHRVDLDSNASGLAVNTVTNRIFASTVGTLQVFDGANDNVIATLPTGRVGTGAVNPATNQVYVPTVSQHCVLVDGATNEYVELATGDGPYYGTTDPVTNKGYFANFNSSSVTVIRGSSRTVAGTLPVGYRPRRLSANPATGKVYIGSNSDTIHVIDESEPCATDSWPTGGTPGVTACNPRTGKVYAADYAGNSVFVVDPESRDTARVAVGSQPDGLAMNPVTNKLYVQNGATPVIVEIDMATNDTAVIPVASCGYAIAANPVSNKVYAYCPPNISVIDGFTRTIVANIPVGNVLGTIAVNPATNRVYASNSEEFSPYVYVIDGAGDSLLASVSTGGTPFGIGINRRTNKIYVACQANSEMTVIDGASNNAETFGVASGPYRLEVDEVLNKVYATNPWSNSVTVMDGATYATTVVAVGASPSEIALDPLSGFVYVPLNAVDSMTVIDPVGLRTVTFAAGDGPNTVCVNPLRGEAYSTSANSGFLMSVLQRIRFDAGVEARMGRLAGDTTSYGWISWPGWARSDLEPNPKLMVGVTVGWNSLHRPWGRAQVNQGWGTDSITWTYVPGPQDTLLFGENYIWALPFDAEVATTGNQGLTSGYAGNVDAMVVYRVVSPYVGSAEPGTRPVGPSALEVLPNPARGRLNVNYSMPAAGRVSLKLYDVTGAVARAVTLTGQAGRHNASLDVSEVARGVYVLKLSSAAGTTVRKVVLE